MESIGPQYPDDCVTKEQKAAFRLKTGSYYIIGDIYTCWCGYKTDGEFGLCPQCKNYPCNPHHNEQYQEGMYNTFLLHTIDGMLKRIKIMKNVR